MILGYINDKKNLFTYKKKVLFLKKRYNKKALKKGT